MISGLVRNLTDFFLKADNFMAEDDSGGCLTGRRGGSPPNGGGLAGITGELENTGFKCSTVTDSTLVPICSQKNLLRRSKTK